MRNVVPVQVGDIRFLVEVADEGGPQSIGLDDVFSFDGVRDTIEAVASELAVVWRKVRPSSASIEFGISISAKNGRLTGLIVEGGGVASLKITLNWSMEAKGKQGTLDDGV